MAFNLVTVKEQILTTRDTFNEMNQNNLDFNKELEWAVQIFTGNDYLLKMDATTVKNSLVNLVSTGLTLNPILKLAHLVPRKGKCCVDVSYMGLIKILTDTGSVKSVKAKPVFSNEPFEIELGTDGFVKHTICKTGDKGKRIGAYSIAVLNDGSNHIEWMYEEELMGIKARSEGVKAGKVTPWATDENEMVRKTVVKRHYKYLPKSERALMAAQAIAFDDENNGIDFEEEKKQRTAANPAATPNAPDETAYATDEDFEEMIRMLGDEVFKKIQFFHYVPKVKVEAFYKKIEDAQTSGMEKSKAEEYLELLRQEIIWWTANPPQKQEV